MPKRPYNPLEKESIGDNIVRELLAQPCDALPTPKFNGAGIYAIYYFGELPAYSFITNKDGYCQTPIYIGKADPKGGRKGDLELDASLGLSLYNRLKDHATSIAEASNLDLSDFQCRFLVVDDIWISLGERRAIQRFLPLWNTIIDGFGNHDPGIRRKDQYRSDWDTVHPGRKWADKLADSPKSAAQILSASLQPASREQLEALASDVLEEENGE